MTPALAAQQAIRTALVADADVLALVPATHILDTSGMPERLSSIVIGEGQELPLNDDIPGVDRYSTVFSTLHVWTRDGQAAAKSIAGAVRACLRGTTWTVGTFKCLDTRFESARFMRDADDPALSHGVVTIRSTVEEA
jgi:hypothetical protein